MRGQKVIVKFFPIFHLPGHPESCPELVARVISGSNKKLIDAEIETLNLIPVKFPHDRKELSSLRKKKGTLFGKNLHLTYKRGNLFCFNPFLSV